MKRLINILAVCLVGIIVFSSCTNSQYRIIAKYVENDSVVIDTLIMTKERVNFKGNDILVAVTMKEFENNIDVSPGNLYRLRLTDVSLETTVICTSLKPIYLDRVIFIK